MWAMGEARLSPGHQECTFFLAGQVILPLVGEGSEHTSGPPGQKKTGQQFQSGLLPRAAAGLLPKSLRQAREGAEGLEAVWSECNSHLLACSQETAAQQLTCLLKVSVIRYETEVLLLGDSWLRLSSRRRQDGRAPRASA